VFVISYVTGKLQMPRSVVLNGILVSSFVALFAIPLFGWLSDLIGRKTMFHLSCAFCIAFAFPFFWLMDSRDPTTITLAIVAAITFGQMVGFGVGAPFYSELFATRLRYSGASPDRGGDLGRTDAFRSGRTGGLERRRDMARLDLSDRRGAHHDHCDSCRTGDGR
jgi:MFS family permease